jgi:citrate lyase subunit beta/citryl-CoA lyase
MATNRLRRSVLYVPASNERALAKVATLAPDAIIFDLEDAVAPDAKAAARDALERAWPGTSGGKAERIIRTNAMSGAWGADDLALAARLEPDAILLPKVDTARDILETGDALDEIDAPDAVALWIMVETPRCLLNLPTIAELGRDRAARLSCFVAGTNDLAKDTGVLATPDRRYLVPWLMQMVLGARGGGLDCIDGVSNDFTDLDAFARECAEGAAMGFDGKTLIHPSQIEPANTAFAPSAEALAEARKIVDAFALAENLGKGVIAMDGRMVERLHLEQAERLLTRAG